MTRSLKSRLLASTALSTTLKITAAGAPLILLPARALAAGSNMPWEQPLNQILESVQGPVAKVVSVIIIVVTGLTLAFGETSGGFRRLRASRSPRRAGSRSPRRI